MVARRKRRVQQLRNKYVVGSIWTGYSRELTMKPCFTVLADNEAIGVRF